MGSGRSESGRRLLPAGNQGRGQADGADGAQTGEAVERQYREDDAEGFPGSERMAALKQG